MGCLVLLPFVDNIASLRQVIEISALQRVPFASDGYMKVSRGNSVDKRLTIVMDDRILAETLDLTRWCVV